MYHIKEDKRAQKSAELIYEGLSSLISRKSFEDITITDIQRESGVGRATFYRSFDNVNDVLYWQCDIHYREVMGGYLGQIGKEHDPYDFLRYFFSYWLEGENSKILEQLISIGHYDIIYRCHFESSLMIKNAVSPRLKNEEKYYQYYMSGLIGAFVGFLITWIQNGKELSVEEIIGMLKTMEESDPVRVVL